MKNLVIIVLIAIIIVLLFILIHKEHTKAPNLVVERTPKRVACEIPKEYNLCQECKDKGVKVENGLNVMVQDGGSMVCNGCNKKYHMCKSGYERYGSPGPTMCPFCKH